MMLAGASGTTASELPWIVGYACGGLILAIPATYIATRRGIRMGLLAGVATFLVVAVVGLAAMLVLVATGGGGSFAVGFGEAVVMAWAGIFLTPSLLFGLVLAAALRWRARSAAS